MIHHHHENKHRFRENGPHDNNGHFSVGDLVRIFGKIECLSTTISKEGNKDFIVREIQASLIERVENNLEAEAEHWMHLCNCAPDNIYSCLNAVGPQILSQINDKVNLPAADDMYSCSWRVSLRELSATLSNLC